MYTTEVFLCGRQLAPQILCSWGEKPTIRDVFDCWVYEHEPIYHIFL